MASLPIVQTQPLIDSLQSIEADTEKIFLELAQALPELVREMKEGFAATDAAIAAMESGTVGHPSAGESGLVAEIQHAVQSWGAQFQTLAAKESAVFDQLHAAVARLEEISASIDHIRLDSEGMEIVSLNAMTVALKAGSAGRAFSYITEELKRLSNRTITLSDVIARSGKELITGFTAFEQELEATRTHQTEFFETFQTGVSRTISDFEHAVGTLIEGSRELRRRSRRLHEPIDGMMETIQLQDLIRQSIDHIKLALDVNRPEEELEDTRSALDELAFLRTIPPLAQSLLDDVAQQIDASVDTFVGLTADAEQRLSELEQEQGDFVAGRADLPDNQPDNQSDTRDMTSILEDLLQGLNQNLQRKSDLVSRSETITGNVENLQSTFRTFHTLANRFRSIDIAARIEVAKQEVLRSMGTSTEKMTTLTKKIGADVENSLVITRDFIESTTGIVNTYHYLYQEENQLTRQFQTDMEGHYRRLHATQQHLKDIVTGFSLFTDRFYTVFERSKSNGALLRNISNAIRDLKTELQTMHAQLEERYQELLRQEDLEEWSIENTRLREIIERFTIFTHKQRAGEMAGFDVDQGVEAGEVTFF